MAYAIEVADEALEHLRLLPANSRAKVIKLVAERLSHQPTMPARNRKRMDPDKRTYVAPWELRLGNLRVYYAVDEMQKTVLLVAVGIKTREKLSIGGKDFAR